MSLPAILHQLRLNSPFMKQVEAWERQPPRPTQQATLPFNLTPSLQEALYASDINHFYTHQAKAITGSMNGDHVVIATATASGKSLCYTIPVWERLHHQPQATALYLFPTKALAQDQLNATKNLLQQSHTTTTVHTYDGDTPQHQRTKIRQNAGILITNPDMLHAGILPYHTRWRPFFRHLQFVVIDEIHTYRGIFGSHVANVLRRLRRLCDFYGSQPQFICCSATIANPQSHAERLVGVPFTLVDEKDNGAPRGEKHIILYNPPLVDVDLGLRQSLTLAARDAAITFINAQQQTAIFGRARQTVELLLTYLQDDMVNAGKSPHLIKGYRGGYLPLERREIERGLRDGTVQGVVATNALELGIDIGALSAVVIAGYPGTIAATWQQAGRAGRKPDEPSAVILVAGNGALDQYICRHPRYLFQQSPEHALINPDNWRLLVNHLQCAAFELPFQKGEQFGDQDIDEALEALTNAGMMHQTQNQTHYLGEEMPAHQFSLRTSGHDNIVIHDTSTTPPHVIGELDRASAPFMVYEGAIYMHQAQTFQVTALDWEGALAQVQPVMVDYYTRATMNSRIQHLAAQAEEQRAGVLHAYGEATISTQATDYRKIRRYTHETLGQGLIDLPTMTLDTMGYWLVFSEDLTEQLMDAGILLKPNNYGFNWQAQRKRALTRDDHRCQTCGVSGGTLHIHHIRPFRDFLYAYTTNPNTPPDDSLPRSFYEQANHLDNLITLCPSCHRRAEVGQQTRSALSGLGTVLRNLAPLFLMCDPSDIAVSADSRSPLTQAPTIVMYEQMPAGVGLSEMLFQQHVQLIASALELVTDCPCRDGCPACVGPPADIGPDTKSTTHQLLSLLV